MIKTNNKQKILQDLKVEKAIGSLPVFEQLVLEYYMHAKGRITTEENRGIKRKIDSLMKLV